MDEAERLKGTRQWAEAAEKYLSAQSAISPPAESAALRLGLCTCYLRLRKAKDAVIWCDKAYTSNADDLQVRHLPHISRHLPISRDLPPDLAAFYGLPRPSTTSDAA